MNLQKILLYTAPLIILIGFFYGGVLQALLLFVMVGMIPGSTILLSPEIMLSLLASIAVISMIHALPSAIRAYSSLQAATTKIAHKLSAYMSTIIREFQKRTTHPSV